MSHTFKKYHSQLMIKLRQLDAEIESGEGDESELHESRNEILRQIKKIEEILKERSDEFIIKTKKGYLTSNMKYTKNINFAYTYSEKEAVSIARKLGGWLEVIPD